MSFQIVDPVQVCNMTQSQLNSILSIEDDSAYIMYVGDDHIEYFVDVLPAEWKVVRTLLDVTRQLKNEQLLRTLFIIDARIRQKRVHWRIWLHI